MRQVRFRPGVREMLRSLEDEDRKRIGYAIHLFATTGTGDVKRLKDLEGELRLRTGDWRIIFTVEEEAIRVIDVSRRDKAYKD